MSAQDMFSAELAAWLIVEAQAPIPASALDSALQATSARRPRPSLVAGVGSHWIGTVPTDVSGRIAVHAPRTARQLLIVALLALLAVALAGAAILVGGGFEQGPAPVEQGPAPQARGTWPGPVQDLAGMLVQPGPQDADGNLGFADARDVSIDWLDITHVWVSSQGQWQWHLELAGRPPRAVGLDAADTLISYGLVFETTGDGRADYVVGINNDAPVHGDYRVWVTDLATGKTEEQVGAPYGNPVEFVHPDEAAPGDHPSAPPGVVFTFPGHSAPPGLTGRSRFYAWSALGRAGETIAWDYGPDGAWFGIQGRLRLPGTAASPAGEYGWVGGTGSSAGMHRVIGEDEDAREATVMRFSVGATCLSARPGALPSQGHSPVPVRLGGWNGISVEPYLPVVGFGRLQGDETTRGYELAVGDRTLCVWLTWHATTTVEELDAAMRILDTLRVEPIGDSRIQVLFTLGAGWDTG